MDGFGREEEDMVMGRCGEGRGILKRTIGQRDCLGAATLLEGGEEESCVLIRRRGCDTQKHGDRGVGRCQKEGGGK